VNPYFAPQRQCELNRWQSQTIQLATSTKHTGALAMTRRKVHTYFPSI